MTYLLDGKLVLDDFCCCDDCVVFNTWATISEVNSVLQGIYDVPLKLIRAKKYNSEVYGLNGSEVRYIESRKLNVRIIPVDNDLRNRLEARIKEL